MHESALATVAPALHNSADMGTRVAVVVLMLTPCLAMAQASIVIDDTEISRAECLSTNPDITVTFTTTVSGGLTGSDEYRVFARMAACVSSELPTTGQVASKTATDSGQQTVNVSADVLRLALGIVASCDSASDLAYYLCAYLVKTDGTIIGTASGGNQEFQLAVPPPPVILSVAPATNALEVALEQGAITAAEKADTGITFHVEASAAGQPTARVPATGSTSSTRLRIGGLTNDVPYTVVAYAYSSAGNRSGASATATGTPRLFLDFWQTYRAADGREQGGCAAGGAGSLSPIGLLALWLLPLGFRRRRP